MQGTRWDEGQARRDPENRLLWRRAPQRLEAEAIRDAMLAVSGCLNEQRFGPGIRPRIPAEAIFKGEAKYGALWPENVVDGPATWRRSIYIFVKRTQPLPILQTFDAPEAVTACSQRTVSTVAPQALALLNDPFVREQAERLASRVRREAGELPARQVDRLYRLALGRPPRATEQDACLRFLARGGSPAGASLADLCQSMMGLNEFIYVD